MRLTHDEWIKTAVLDNYGTYWREADGRDYTVEAGGATYGLRGDDGGSITVNGAGEGNAIRDGNGEGDANRCGAGKGEAFQKDTHGTYMRGWRDGYRIGEQNGHEFARLALLHGMVLFAVIGLVVSGAVWALLYFVG